MKLCRDRRPSWKFLFGVTQGRCVVALLAGIGVLGLAGIGPERLGRAEASEAAKLPFDTYSGYFVSNKFEPDAADSFVVLTSQEQFDKVFGVAFVMHDKSHRLPDQAFKSRLVIAPIKRGHAFWEFKVESVTAVQGVVELRYTTASQKFESATFACPLIVSLPRGDYRAVQFVENGKPVKKVEVAKP